MMINPAWLSALALIWMLSLFAIAWMGDKWSRRRHWNRWHPLLYTLSLGVYCTTWTFFGSVGQLADSGWFFPPTYFGAIILFLFATPLIQRVVRISKEQNLSSIADVLAARYGRSATIAGVVTLIAITGIIPYIALQLKALTYSFDVLTGTQGDNSWWRDTALWVTVLMIGFTIFFGARHSSTSEQQPGLLFAIAIESIFKLIILLCLGYYAWHVSSVEAWQRLPVTATTANNFTAYAVQSLLGVIAMIALPRQFHLTVIENENVRDLAVAKWGVPLYLSLLGLALLPIIFAGQQLLPVGTAADTYVIHLPLSTGSPTIAMLAFMGGLAAATSMIVVASVALSTMVSQSFFVPMLLRLPVKHEPLPFNTLLLWCRRLLIGLVLFSAFIYYKSIVAQQKLAAIGLVSFVAVAQFAPALIGALFWSRAQKRGALWGLLAGWLVWFWTLVLPDLVSAGWLSEHSFAMLIQLFPWLNPNALFYVRGFDPVSHGAIMSLSINSAVFYLLSILSTPSVIERLQAKRFLARRDHHQEWQQHSPLWPEPTTMPVSELVTIVARFYGEHAARERFLHEAQLRQLDSLNVRADQRWLDFTLREITGVVGAASARSVLHVALRRGAKSLQDVELLVNEASHILQFNQALLSATLNTLEQGVIVVDRQLRVVAWNPSYTRLFQLPEHFLFIGRPIADVLRFNAAHLQASIDIEHFIARRLAHLQMGRPHHVERELADGRVLEIHGVAMPGGGYVTSYADISEHKRIQRELQTSNERLEQRVNERTDELAKANLALSRAKQIAELADAGKTRFLAAASHDLVQPLNAAQLFADALQTHITDDNGKKLLQQLSQSLQANEDLLKSLLDISKLDAGVIKAEIDAVALPLLLQQLHDEFAPLALKNGLQLTLSICDRNCYADHAMLRRLLQNLISNAIRYTEQGEITISSEVMADSTIEIAVSDTGIGIASDHLNLVFEEFRRTPRGMQKSPAGHGLGLAIVQRLARALHSDIVLHSELNRGSRFSLRLPLCATAPRATDAPLAHGKTPLSHRRILCLDNDAAMLAGLDAVLQSWQCETTLTKDRLEFMASANPLHDIVIADYQLDNGDNGIDVWLQLPQPRPPLVLLSAVRDKNVIARVQALGGHYLAKPVRPLALRSVLHSVLQQREFTVGD